MLTDSASNGASALARSTLEAMLCRLRPPLWQVVAFVSCAAGLGAGWRILINRIPPVSPIMVSATMVVVTFAGWLVWGFFTHQIDVALYGGHSDYLGTLNAFGRAYVFQVLLVLVFTKPLGCLWGWLALYATVVAWGLIGPRHLGMRTLQAIVSATLGMVLWVVCLLVLSLMLQMGGIYVGVGVFLI